MVGRDGTDRMPFTTPGLCQGKWEDYKGCSSNYTLLYYDLLMSRLN